MKKLVPIGLVALLLYHTLAYVLVCLGVWWQAQHDLTERLMVYRSTDSLVDFQLPLTGALDVAALARTTSDGFRYRGHYYTVVSMDVRRDTLFIAGLEVANHAVWPDDLLAFLNNHLTGDDVPHQKAHQFLKFLLKEYPPAPPVRFCFGLSDWSESNRVADTAVMFQHRTPAVYSPPPEGEHAGFDSERW